MEAPILEADLKINKKYYLKKKNTFFSFNISGCNMQLNHVLKPFRETVKLRRFFKKKKISYRETWDHCSGASGLSELVIQHNPSCPGL